MAKTKISEYDATAANNTDIDGINIAESCAPSGINNALRSQMSHLKDGLGAGTPVFLDQTNNRVGISNSSPETKLHINDSGTAPPSSGYGTGLNVARSDGLIGVTVGYNSANLGSYIQAKNFTNSDMKNLLLNPQFLMNSF